MSPPRQLGLMNFEILIFSNPYPIFRSTLEKTKNFNPLEWGLFIVIYFFYELIEASGCVDFFLIFLIFQNGIQNKKKINSFLYFKSSIL